QRRLEMARALATGPKLLLLDEPTAGMDPNETGRMTHFIRRLREERKITILLIEHDMKVVMGISDRVTVLDHGTKIAEGVPASAQGHRPHGRPRPHEGSGERDRPARCRALAGGTTDLLAHVGEREPGDGRLRANRSARGAREGLRARVRALPAAEGKADPARRHTLWGRAADARDRTRPDGTTDGAAARRAIDGARAGAGRARLQDD